jgi:predicted  nucleic acid-binding Zn-ribbon protein
MSGLSDVFRHIHRLRRQTHDLQEQIDRVPRQRRIQQAKVTRQEEALREGQEAVRKLKVTIHEKEVSLKATHTQVAKHRRQLNEAAGKKEYDALKSEISHDEGACGRLEDEILQAMTDSEEAAARVPELEQAVRQAKEEYDRYEAGVEERLGDLRAQLAEAQQQLADAEAQVPADVRPPYDRVVAAMGPDSLAAVRGRFCSACHTEITAQNFNDLLIGRFLVCKSCGRVLYLPE